jgi:hypothetical protein
VVLGYSPDTGIQCTEGYSPDTGIQCTPRDIVQSRYRYTYSVPRDRVQIQVYSVPRDRAQIQVYSVPRDRVQIQVYSVLRDICRPDTGIYRLHRGYCGVRI